MIYVQKYPDPYTLAATSQEPLPGYEAMAKDAFDQWLRDQLVAGWTPAELPAPAPTVPTEVTPRQFWLALLSIGITEEMVVAQLEGNEAALITVRKALSVSRQDPLVDAMAAMLGKSEADVDAIFQLAATL